MSIGAPNTCKRARSVRALNCVRWGSRCLAHNPQRGADGAHLFGALSLTFLLDKHNRCWIADLEADNNSLNRDLARGHFHSQSVYK